MHATIVSTAAVALATLEAYGVGFPSGLILITVLVSVAIVGIPHGAADHWKGRRLLTPLVGSLWVPIFLISYLSISALVLVGWYIAPTMTMISFFVAAAWHFGIEDRMEDSTSHIFHLRAIACGGLVIWIPCVMRGDEITYLLSLISNSISAQTSGQVVSLIAACSPLLAGFVFLDSYLEIRKLRNESGIARTWLRSRTVRYASLSLLFCVADPLLSFGVYFCGWHSIRSLHELYVETGCSLPSLIRKLAPLTFVTIALFLVGFTLWSRGLTISEASIRWLFLGLSSIAIPHLLLDVISSNSSLRTGLASTRVAGASS